MNRPAWLIPFLALVGAGLLLASCREDGSPATAHLELAEDWFGFFESGQVELYQNLIATDAWWRCEGCKPEVREGPYFGGRHGSDLTDARDSLLLFAAGGSITPICTVAGHVVTCEVRLTDAFREKAGLRPYRSRYQFTFDQSEISDLLFEPLPPNDRYQTGSQINDYSGWLRQTNPQMHRELFLHGTMIVEPYEKASRHRQLIDDWQSSN